MFGAASALLRGGFAKRAQLLVQFLFLGSQLYGFGLCLLSSFSFRGQARARLLDTGDISLLGSGQSFKLTPQPFLSFSQFSDLGFARLAGHFKCEANAFFLSKNSLLFVFEIAKRVNLCVNLTLFFSLLFRPGLDSIARFQLREYTRFYFFNPF